MSAPANRKWTRRGEADVRTGRAGRGPGILTVGACVAWMCVCGTVGEVVAAEPDRYVNVAVEQPPADTRFDLATARLRALDIGLDATRARLAVMRARTEVQAADGARMPDLRLGASATTSVGRTFSEALGRNVTEPQALAGARVTANVPLWAGGQLLADQRSARASLNAAEASAEGTRLAVTLTLAQALLDLEAARGAQALAVADLDAERALRDAVAVRVEAGARTRADLLQQEAALAQSEADAAVATADIARAELVLCELLLLDPSVRWTFVAPTEAPEVPTLDAVLARARTRHPTLAAAEAARAVAVQDIRAAKALGLPGVDLSAGAATSWLSTNPSPLPTQLGDQGATWATVDVSVPLLDRGVTRDAVARATLALAEADRARDAALAAVEADVRAAFVGREEAAAALRAAEARRAAAAAAESVVRERYEAGAAVIFELIAARASLADADRALLQARIGWLRAGFVVEAAVG